MSTVGKSYHHGNLREALLERAEIALEKGGAQDLTLRELCRTLGVSHASSRRHFADKRALLDAVAERGFRRFGADVAEAVADRDRSFVERLKSLAQTHVRFALAHPGLFRWMFEAKYRSGASPELERANQEALQTALQLYEDGRAAGELIDVPARDCALLAFATVQGLIALSDKGGVWGTPLEALAAKSMDRLLDGLKSR